MYTLVTLWFTEEHVGPSQWIQIRTIVSMTLTTVVKSHDTDCSISVSDMILSD